MDFRITDDCPGPGKGRLCRVEQLGSNWTIMMTNGGWWGNRNKDYGVEQGWWSI